MRTAHAVIADSILDLRARLGAAFVEANMLQRNLAEGDGINYTLQLLATQLDCAASLCDLITSAVHGPSVLTPLPNPAHMELRNRLWELAEAASQQGDKIAIVHVPERKRLMLRVGEQGAGKGGASCEIRADMVVTNNSWLSAVRKGYGFES